MISVLVMRGTNALSCFTVARANIHWGLVGCEFRNVSFLGTFLMYCIVYCVVLYCILYCVVL